MTFDATLNPVVYEGGIPVFIDTEASSWNIVKYLEDIEGTAECFPYDVIQELREVFWL